MINMNDLKIEPIYKKRTGMQPVTVWTDLRVIHLPTGIVIEMPHEYQHSQSKHLETAIKMLETLYD